ncbi:predicted protein [Nematostella vectensis]|uniref:Uncharacterized protein n=2 Tax=Nematostella vectensis TaxID=45351 RepID=A7SPL4_NEMVE|nr:predicted protein [Nematostella vectensis]|eukprot:XP_001626426.1 predicted protein [Nematostella vectensis]
MNPMFSEHVARFVLGGLSCMTATTVTNPIEVVKIRMQLDNELGSKHNSKDIFRERYYKGLIRTGLSRVYREEGVRGLYRGIFPALLRQAIYSSTRLGAYEPIKNLLGATDSTSAALWKKIVAGVSSGVIGSAIATPTDLVKIRFQAVKIGETIPYKNMFHAFYKIAKKEGFLGLWTGMKPTVKRAACISGTQIPTYDHTKHLLLNAELMREGVALHLASALVAGFVATCVASPVDIVRTRFMTQPKDTKGRPLVYQGTLDCIYKTVRHEGILALYKGFFPNWTRTGLDTIIIFFVYERLRRYAGLDPI